MIYIQGTTAPPFLLAWSGLERSIYRAKQLSPTPFHYSSEAALRFELKLRASIVRAAEGLARSGAAFETFEGSRCHELYWIRTEKGGFLLRPGARPSDAITDIFVNGQWYAFECAMAIVIVLYKAVLDTAGPEAFDRLFGDLYLYSWNHDSDLKLVSVYGKGEAFPGDVQYIKNPDVHPAYIHWQGENVIVMPEGLYFGHGVAVTRAEYIIERLNTHRIPGSMVSAYMLDEATFPNFPALQEALERVSGAPIMPEAPAIPYGSAPGVWAEAGPVAMPPYAASSGSAEGAAVPGVDGAAATWPGLERTEDTYRMRAVIGSREYRYA
ncbi:protein-glutamine gamma-glutamyltransferase [Paenibacillus sp. YYML68]|uniref:protein-glutamine gamma-glutamyltransferase n=1 Tax=Paenibacillus sp. YYML68 TaxID=2909250 RepID=UPI002492E2CF|nr:protein-glutamine gamma-glutamyltransferase [Paenibacillus sp. YYML68]